MTLESQLLLLLSAFGALNGFIVSAYLFISSKQKLSQKFLALMLLMVSIRIFKSVLFFFNPEVDKLILQIGLSACFLIGPFLYFYVSALRDNLTSLPLSWRIHLACLIAVLLLVSVLYPYHSHPSFWGGIVYNAVNFTWFLYLLLSLHVSKASILQLWGKAERKLAEEDILLLCVLAGNSLILCAYFFASYTSYIVGALSFSFIFLFSFMLAFFKFNGSQHSKKMKYGDQKMSEKEASDGVYKLDQLMKEQVLFKNPNITMPQVAKRLGMSSPKFSQLLNLKLNKSFSVYINELRIELAKQYLIEQPKYKMDDIADLCGFNSSSTFYSAFKKHAGVTPAKFREQLPPK